MDVLVVDCVSSVMMIVVRGSLFITSSCMLIAAAGPGKGGP